MENFVPYELAVKLEQKGFKQGYNIFGFRPIFSDETTIRFISEIGAYEKEYFGENIAAPTISQVLKWLREEKKLHISIEYGYEETPIWDFEIRLIENYGRWWTDETYSSYELAVIAGIEYVIDNNLI